MDQKITIKLGGKEFKLTASSPQQEEAIRLATNTINNRLQELTTRHPGKPIVDLMAMVALNETVSRIILQKDLKKFDAESGKLGEDLERYLSDQDK